MLIKGCTTLHHQYRTHRIQHTPWQFIGAMFFSWHSTFITITGHTNRFHHNEGRPSNQPSCFCAHHHVDKKYHTSCAKNSCEGNHAFKRYHTPCANTFCDGHHTQGMLNPLTGGQSLYCWPSWRSCSTFFTVATTSWCCNDATAVNLLFPSWFVPTHTHLRLLFWDNHGASQENDSGEHHGEKPPGKLPWEPVEITLKNEDGKTWPMAHGLCLGF